MDELEKEVIKATADAALAPVTKVAADLIGLAGGDWIAHKRRMAQERREKNTRDTAQRAKALLDQRGVEPDPETATEHVEQILEAAGDESHAEVKELFARLLAAAMDSKRKNRFRRDYIEVVRQLEPLDALVLNDRVLRADVRSVNAQAMSETFGRPRDELIVSFENLQRLGLIDSISNGSPQALALTSKGRQFTELVSD